MLETEGRSVRAQAEVARLRRERAELEDRAEEAEGGLAAAQTDMETSRKRLEAELATARTEARRTAEEAQLEHSSEVRNPLPWRPLSDALYNLARI